ncbi:c6 zinc finger domain containing protein [Niveomyces insectorum RCEF 264]|uniref:C6 zinc finger domain containing protein n=1 Tax=Niveomyces insectorum RCEF 264 TaxID=1081102 RepID=A0A167YLZ9_9HYPO|nr:c6 zinc finger domain containing protein [Niveomyces insectorum RCEF 264]
MEESGAPRYRTRPAAIYDRKRAGAACSVCRARKTRCNGERPVCGYCRVTGGDCRYPELDATRLDQGSLEILTRIGQLEASLKAHMTDAVAAELRVRGAAPAAGIASTGASVSPVSAGRPTEAAASRPGPGATVSLTDVPPSADVLAHASEMSLEAVLKWPIFAALVPHLAADLHTPTAEVLAQDGPIATVTEHDIALALQSLSPAALDRLVDNFLANNNIKHPVLDSNALRGYVCAFNATGPQWDSQTCLILLVCAVSSVSTSLDEEQEPGLSKSAEQLTRAEAYFQAAQRRIGMVYHETSILAGQCAFMTGVYLCSTYQIVAGWKAFVHASNQCLAWLRSNGRLQQRKEGHAGQTGVYTVAQGSQTAITSEVRSELCLPGSGLDRFDYPNMYPSPPIGYHLGADPVPVVGGSPPMGTTPLTRSGDHHRHHHKDRHNVEIGWLYYLAEIATKRIRANVWTESYASTALPAAVSNADAGWILQLDKRVREFDWQLREWYEALPQQIRFPANNTQPTGDITRYILRHHMLDIQEDVRFPAIQAILGTAAVSSLSSSSSSSSSSSGLVPLRELSPTLVRLARELLVTAMHRIQAARECFFHRHHGQWFGIRCLGRNALQLLGVACRCHQDVQGDEGIALEKQFLPQGWDQAIHLASSFLAYWSDDTPMLHHRSLAAASGDQAGHYMSKVSPKNLGTPLASQ